MLSAARAELREARQVEASRECQSPQVQHQGIPLTNLSFDISICVPLRPLWLTPLRLSVLCGETLFTSLHQS
jgi:hypothetical protein